jgi:hypothetical protein
MDLLFWMGRVFARFVAVSVTILSAWTFVLNLGGSRGWDTWVLILVLASGLVGALGGVLYLLSLDGPERFRTRTCRTASWGGMLLAMLLPTSLSFMLVPLVIAIIPTLFIYGGRRDEAEEIATSS